MKIQTRLLSGYAVISVLIVGLGALILSTIHRTSPIVDELDRQVEALGRAMSLSGLSGNIASLRADLSRSTRQLIATTDPTYEREYDRASRHIVEVFDEAIKKSETEDEATIFRNLREASEKLEITEREMIVLAKANNFEEARGLSQSDRYVELNAAITNFIVMFANRKQVESHDEFSRLIDISTTIQKNRESLRMLARVTWVSVLLIFVSSILIGILLARMIARPVRALREGAVRIGEGSLDHRIGMKRKDEIGGLSNAFDDMAERLRVSRDAVQASNQKLEDRVRERTGELEATNESLGHEVVERRQAEKELRKSEKRFRDLFDSASDVILSVDEAGRILMVNPRGEELTGFTREELLRRNVLEDLIVPEDRDKVTAAIRQVRGGMATRHEVRWTADDGRLIEFEVSCSPQFTDAGEFSSTMCILRDVSDRKRAEEALRRTKDELEDRVIERTEQLGRAKQAAETANQAKSEFLANMSHEIRTPLHGILSFARFGVDEALTAEPELLFDYFQKIDVSGKRLMVLLNDVLDLAKMDSGRMNFEFAPADLLAVTRSVQDEFNLLLAGRNVRVELGAPDFETRLTMDDNRVAQVIRNLLSNAARFSPDGGTISLSMVRTDDSIILSVRDQGVGIPEEELEAVFDKFVQSSKTRSGAGGTGLGLSICRQIVDAHRGRIWAENHPEGGAVFHVQLPLNLDSDLAADEAKQQRTQEPAGV